MNAVRFKLLIYLVGAWCLYIVRQKDTGTSCNFPERFSFSIPSGDLDQEVPFSLIFAFPSKEIE